LSDARVDNVGYLVNWPTRIDEQVTLRILLRKGNESRAHQPVILEWLCFKAVWFWSARKSDRRINV
jgi:hypothetical protein